MSPGLGLLLALLGQPVAPETGAWYLQRFGPLQPRDAAEERNLREAHEVFAALQPVADRQQRREPRLLPLQRGGRPEARALPDGTVVVNGALLELCFRSGDRAAGRARLAFVLGHEMAHLASGDAWEAEAFASAERSGDGELARRARQAADLSPEAREAREARADEAGFLFATMAGFDTAAVLGERGDFLDEWSARVGGEDALRRRGRLLRARLTEVADALPFFTFGVRLLQLGRFADSRACWRASSGRSLDRRWSPTWASRCSRGPWRSCTAATNRRQCASSCRPCWIPRPGRLGCGCVALRQSVPSCRGSGPISTRPNAG